MPQRKDASEKPIAHANFAAIPQHSNFYAGFFQAFCNPFAFQFPYSGTGEDTEWNPPNKPRCEAEEAGVEAPQQPGLDHAKEAQDAHLEEWVIVEEDLGTDWVSVKPKRTCLPDGSSRWRERAGWHTHNTTDA